MPDTDSRENRLQAVLVAYVEARERGETPDRAAWLARYPEFAAELAAFIDDHQRIAGMAAGLQDAATVPPLPPGVGAGLRYVGDYVLEAEIARGGMGIVFRAKQVSLSRPVAVKVLLAGTFAAAEQVRRFRQEAEAAAGLDHPNIVPIYEVGEHQGHQYFSMKLVEGGSLAGRLRQPPPLSPRDLAALVATVARAVHHAHQRGILHRDLKPANILLDPDGTAHVADFGLAKVLSGVAMTAAEGDGTRTGALVGTPLYMAPEQAAGRKDLTVAVDVYALGTILYEGLTGQPPFQGERLLERIQTVEPRRLRLLVPGVPADLETVCLKCLAKEPERRYESAAALAEDLERWQRGEPITARPVGSMERAWRWSRRNPAWAALAATVLLGLAVTTSTTVWALQEKAEAEQRRSAAETAQDATERTLARSLLWPLDLKAPDELSKPEAEALWLLAQQPGERRLRVVEEAARDPLAAQQLRTRADPALVAALGMDPAKREQAERLLVAKLRDPSLSLRHRADLALVALDLVAPPATADASCGAILVQTLMINPPELREEWCGILLARIDRLAPADAAITLTQALDKEMNADHRNTLAHGLMAVAERLPPTNATNTLAQALDKETNFPARRSLAKGLAAMAERLPPTDAVMTLTQALDKETHGAMRRELAEGLATVAARLSPAAAARVWIGAVKTILHVLDQETDGVMRRSLAEGLPTVAALVPRTDAAQECAAVVNLLAHALDQETDAWTRWKMAEGLAAVAAQLPPADAARGCSDAVRKLAQALDQEMDVSTRQTLAAGLAAVASQLPPLAAAKALTQALEKETKADARQTLAEGLVAVAARLPPAESAHFCAIAAKALPPVAMDGLLPPAEAAKQLAGALAQATDFRVRTSIAQTLAVVAGELSPAEATRVCTNAMQTLAQAMDREKVAYARQVTAQSLASMAARLATAEAGRICGDAAKSLAQALDKEKDANAREHLAEGLAAIAARLPPAEAAKVYHQALHRLTQDLTPNLERKGDLVTVKALAFLVTRLDAETAWPFRLALPLCAVRNVNGRENGPYGPDTLDHLLTDARWLQVRTRAVAAATVAAANHSTLSLLATLPAAAEPLPCRLTDQQLVELLKMPTCFGAVRQVVLKHLGNRYRHAFANHWAFVRFAQERGLNLDFTTPPKRPQPGPLPPLPEEP